MVFRRLFAVLWEVARGLLLLSASLRLAEAIVPLLTLWISKLIVDRVVQVVKTGDLGRTSEIWWLVATEIALVVGADLLGRATVLSDGLLTMKVERHLTLQVLHHTATLNLSLLEEAGCQNRLERARLQVGARLEMLVGIGHAYQSGITLLSLAGGVLSFSPLLFVLLALSMVPVLIHEIRYAHLSHDLTRKRTSHKREQDYIRFLGANAETAKEMRLLGLEDFLADRYGRLAQYGYDDHWRLARRRAIAGSILSALSTASYYLAYIVILRHTLANLLTVGDMVFLAGVFMRSRASMQQAITGISSIVQQWLNLRDLFEFLDLKPTLSSPPKGVPAPRPLARGIEFRNVSFRYPGAPRDMLRNVNFSLAPGEHLALVGNNGAGKTTLIKLLTRLYDPTGGVILLDGVDLREYDLADLHRTIGVVFQDFVRFDMTVQENIGLGSVDHLHDHERVASAAARSGFSDAVARLPDGYATLLGRRFGGRGLSGGEWQKLALARAYQRDAQIVVLDEPTASLDAQAEYEIFRRFVEMTRGRTAIVISHRFSTVRIADRIIVLEHGAIREQGTHDQLLRRGGRYADMFTLQAHAYH
jgi:ATP-binding cassette, subfamily B, bacterial